jgi:hypothetical protein
VFYGRSARKTGIFPARAAPVPERTGYGSIRTIIEPGMVHKLPKFPQRPSLLKYILNPLSFYQYDQRVRRTTENESKGDCSSLHCKVRSSSKEVWAHPERSRPRQQPHWTNRIGECTQRGKAVQADKRPCTHLLALHVFWRSLVAVSGETGCLVVML